MLTQHSDQPAKKRRKNMFKLTTLSARKHYLSLSRSRSLSRSLSLSLALSLYPSLFLLFVHLFHSHVMIFTFSFIVAQTTFICLILCFHSHYFSLYTFSSFPSLFASRLFSIYIFERYYSFFIFLSCAL